MADITEVFDDVSENIGKSFKNVSKNKAFWWIAGGVAVIALGAYFLSNRSSGTEYAIGTGYAGYPVTVGSSEDMTGLNGFTDSEVNALLNEIAGSYESTIADMEESYKRSLNRIVNDYDVYIDGLTETVNSLSDQLVTTQKMAETNAQVLERQNILTQMQSNSNLYNALAPTSDKATLDALHEQNVLLGTSIGLTYNNGVWYDEIGTPAYMPEVTATTSAITTGKPSTGSGSVYYDSNVDYSQKIINGILSGEDVNTINTYEVQRDAKIAGTGMSTAQANSGFDANIDYSYAIAQAKSMGASADVVSLLETQRQNKINALYGGVDPAKTTTSTTTTTTTTKPATTATSSTSSTSSNTSSEGVKKSYTVAYTGVRSVSTKKKKS